MINFLWMDENTLYLMLIVLLVAIALLEGLGVLFGVSVLSFLESEPSVEVDLDAHDGILTKTFGWMCFGKFPILIWLVLVLSNVSIAGLLANYLSQVVLNHLLPLIFSFPIALVFGAKMTQVIGNKLEKILPKNESSALSVETFVGGVATITIGTAKVGMPAEACYLDSFQQKHYLLVEPLTDDETFSQGQAVILIQKESRSWKASNLKR